MSFDLLQNSNAALLAARYGEPDAKPLLFPELLASMLSHRSIRNYTSEPLPEGTLEVLVAAAQSASSSSNLQCWSVIAVTDTQRKARLAELAGDQAHIREAPLFLVWIADLARLALAAEQQGIPAAGLDYTEMFLVAAIDASLAAQNAVIAAEALGLGVVYIGAMRNKPEQAAELLGLPARTFAVFGTCIGYADNTPTAVKPRLGQQAVLHHERYDLTGQIETISRYNTAMQRFYAEQQMAVKGSWARHSARRVSGPESLSGRDRLVEALHNRGFELK